MFPTHEQIGILCQFQAHNRSIGYLEIGFYSTNHLIFYMIGYHSQARVKYMEFFKKFLFMKMGNLTPILGPKQCKCIL